MEIDRNLVVRAYQTIEISNNNHRQIIESDEQIVSFLASYRHYENIKGWLIENER